MDSIHHQQGIGRGDIEASQGDTTRINNATKKTPKKNPRAEGGSDVGGFGVFWARAVREQPRKRRSRLESARSAGYGSCVGNISILLYFEKDVCVHASKYGYKGSGLPRGGLLWLI